MPALSTISPNHAQRTRPGTTRPHQRSRRVLPAPIRPLRLAIPQHASSSTPGLPRFFAPLIDAKAAGELLGVPHTWLLAQARMGRIPHHRLGHYVRFNPEDLQAWLKQTRSMPHEPRRRV